MPFHHKCKHEIVFFFLLVNSIMLAARVAVENCQFIYCRTCVCILRSAVAKNKLMLHDALRKVKSDPCCHVWVLCIWFIALPRIVRHNYWHEKFFSKCVYRCHNWAPPPQSTLSPRMTSPHHLERRPLGQLQPGVLDDTSITVSRNYIIITQSV